MIHFPMASGRVIVFCSAVSLALFHAKDGLAALEETPKIQCDIQAISSLWPDSAGGFVGSSKVEWNDCSDGNDYLARCLHHGSGQTMESCSCEVSGVSLGERRCAQPSGEDNLIAVSRACCGFPVLEAR